MALTARRSVQLYYPEKIYSNLLRSHCTRSKYTKMKEAWGWYCIDYWKYAAFGSKDSHFVTFFTKWPSRLAQFFYDGRYVSRLLPFFPSTSHGTDLLAQSPGVASNRQGCTSLISSLGGLEICWYRRETLASSGRDIPPARVLLHPPREISSGMMECRIDSVFKRWPKIELEWVELKGNSCPWYQAIG